jgi:hypothetical protein
MKRISYYLLAGVTLASVFTLTNCKKESSKDDSLVMVTPVIDRNQAIIGTTAKKFTSEKEFVDFIKTGLNNISFEKIPLVTKRIKPQQSGAIASKIDEDDTNPCPDNNSNGDPGGHAFNNGVQTSSTFNSTTGFNLGLSISMQYNATGNGITVIGGSALLTGNGTAPQTQQSSGNSFVNGTTISTTGTINATWSTGHTSTLTATGTSGSNASAGFNISAGVFSANASGGGSFSTSVTSTTSSSGTSTTTSQFTYEMSRDVCSGSGNLKVYMNGQLLFNQPL